MWQPFNDEEADSLFRFNVKLKTDDKSMVAEASDDETVAFPGGSCTQVCCLDGSGDTNRTFCQPGFEFCGVVRTDPNHKGSQFHLRDRTGCGENDPNGIVFDPHHGVIHHFFQKHVGAPGPGPMRGPVYGHFASKDLINWAEVGVAIWNGFDWSTAPPRVTPWDNQAIYTGSAFVVDGAGPGGKGPGVINLYPGLCTAASWPNCKPSSPGSSTGTVLAQAVPTNYELDVLLINWTKPTYNPVVAHGTRDPASPWRTVAGEWRTRTFDGSVYGSASDADALAGRWYDIGKSATLKEGECPSLYPLPAATPGFEDEYKTALNAGTLPTHVRPLAQLSRQPLFSYSSTIYSILL